MGQEVVLISRRERWLRLVCCVHRVGILRVTHDRRPSCRCDVQTRQSCWDHRSQSVQLLSITIPLSDIMEEIQDVVSPLKKTFARTPITWIAVGTAIWKGVDRKWLGERPKLGKFVHAPRKGLVSVCLCWRRKKGVGRKTIWIPCGTYGWNNLISKSKHFCKSTYTWCVHSENASQIWNPRKKTKDLLESLISAGIVKQFPDWDKCKTDLFIVNKEYPHQ